MPASPLSLYLGTILRSAKKDQAGARTAGTAPAARQGRVTRAARAVASVHQLSGPRLGDFDSVEDDYYRFLNRPRD